MQIPTSRREVIWTLYFLFFWYEFQVTDAIVRKMEYSAIVGAIALDHVITNDF
jgi:hypothetical protein